MNTKINYDIAIIGAGSAGLSVAAVAGQLGLKVVLIEHHKMGGDCLNVGCVPSKSFIAAAKAAHAFLTAEKFGIKSVEPNVNFNQVMEHVANVIQTIAPNDSVERFTQLGVDVICASAKFLDKQTLMVDNQQITARRMIIATGSSPSIPPIAGLDQINFYTNENIFNLRQKPEHLIVIGGGPIGCELAQAFSFLGVKITILEAFKILPRDEPDLVTVLRHELIAQGISVFENVTVREVKETNHIIAITIEMNGEIKTIEGSHLLIATGRKPNTENLGLEAANVAFTKKGIQVDKHLRTTNKKIYAIGDVAGAYQFTHMSNYHAGIVIRNAIFKSRAVVDYRVVPWVTYTSPELAHVGLTEEDAIKQQPNAKMISIDLKENDRAQTECETRGKIKVIATTKGQVLGVSILAPHASELILPWIMLMQQKKTLRTFTDTIIPYPTFNELSKRAASEFYKPLLFSTWMRRLVNYLKFF